MKPFKWYLVAVFLSAVCTAYSQEEKYFQKPFKVQDNGKPLDIANGKDRSTYDWGHAGPYYADVDGDHKRDLIVGGFSGRFRLYRNTGTEQTPQFTGFGFIMGGDTVARVPIYCCIGSSPLLTDLDGDRIPDLLSGSYDPGYFYWFKGLGQGKFGKRQILLDEKGSPVATHALSKDHSIAFGTTTAPVDWDNDGDDDLLLGSFRGQVFIRKNIGSADKPLFSATQEEIRIGNANAIPEQHAAVNVADWDGDGLWDILIGSDAGSVYLLPNSGKKGTPAFNSRQMIIGPGDGEDQWVETGSEPKRGIRAQIHVVDFNGDGKPDILLGDFSTTISLKKGLSKEEIKKATSLIDEYKALEKKTTAKWKEIQKKKISYDAYKRSANDHPMVKEFVSLQKKKMEKRDALSAWLEPRSGMPRKAYTEKGMVDMDTDRDEHGFVWVFLRK